MDNKKILQDDLIKNQSFLLKNIKKSHKWFFIYFYASLVFVFMFSIFSLIAIINNPLLSPPFYLSACLIILMLGVIHLKDYFQFLTNLRIAFSTINFQNSKKSPNEFINGVTSYINKVYFLLFYLTSSSKSNADISIDLVRSDIERMFKKNILINTSLGIAIFVLFILITFTDPNLIVLPFFYISFLIILFSYIMILFSVIKMRSDTQKWLISFSAVISWGKSIEAVGMNE